MKQTISSLASRYKGVATIIVGFLFSVCKSLFSSSGVFLEHGHLESSLFSKYLQFTITPGTENTCVCYCMAITLFTGTDTSCISLLSGDKACWDCNLLNIVLQKHDTNVA